MSNPRQLEVAGDCISNHPEQNAEALALCLLPLVVADFD